MIHGVRDHFNLQDFLTARENTIKLVEEVVSSLEEGMNESDCLYIVDKTLKLKGVQKKWHPSKFRIGQDTLRSFSGKSGHNNCLKDGEIFFLDIGPVWNGYEGDYGKTYIFGDDLNGYKKLADGAENIFYQTSNHWKKTAVGGIELYDYARNCANILGFELNDKMSGHRLGDFPHHLFYRGRL